MSDDTTTPAEGEEPLLEKSNPVTVVQEEDEVGPYDNEPDLVHLPDDGNNTENGGE